MTNTETVSTERLAFLKLWAEQSDDEITLKASEVRELLASRTQSPAEWQVEVQAAMSLMRRLGVTKLTWGDLAGMTSILAPDRSKEETGVRRLLDDNVIETIHGVYLMKVREYDADFRRDTPEDFWQKKYGTNLHSTGLGERWALKEALSQALSALETPPLHKEGEDHGRYLSRDDYCATDEGHPLDADYAAPVPVPVTSEADGGFWRTSRKFQIGDRVTKTKGSSWTGKVVGFYSTALTPVGYAVESENEPGSVQIYPEAALYVKPGEQG